MKKPFISAFLAAASLMVGTVAQAGNLPSITIDGSTTVDGETQDWTATLDVVDVTPEGNLYYQLDSFTLTFLNGDTVDISDLSNILDPTGSFNTSYFDAGAPSTFRTVFNFTPFDPTLTKKVTFTGSVAGSATDGTSPKNGVSYTPVGTTVFNYQLFDRNNTLVGSFGLDPGNSFPKGQGSQNSHTTGPYDNGEGITANCGVIGCGTVKVTATFTGSGGNDRYSWTGRWDIFEKQEPIPEPSATVALVGMGLFGAVFLGRRRVS